MSPGEKTNCFLTLPSPGKFLVLLILFNCHLSADSQVIKGTVFDGNTKSPISYAYLYFSGTFSGTQTDQNGNFTLNASVNRSIPLTVSAIGYYSVTLNEFLTGKPLSVYLTQKVYALKEVNISAKSLARKRRSNLILFKAVFLGTTDNASDCKILNESDITFNYNSDRDTLKAFASKPILIDNKALGYKVTYYLDKFEYTRADKSFNFKGNIVFQEDLNTVQEQKEHFERKRKYAYLGSRMHFFRALWYDDLKSTGFIIKGASSGNLSYKDIVIEDANKNKFLRYGENLTISYYSRLPLTGLGFLKEKVLFSNDGYYDPECILWEGYMASLRIADWLPYEYSIIE
jgi:hypothetical protein